LHRMSEAKARIEAAREILQTTKDYPAERIRLDSHADVYLCALADYEAETGNPRHALEIYEELLRKVLAYPATPDTSLPDATSLSRVYEAMADLERRIGRVDRSSAWEARRMEIWRRWDAKLPHNSFVGRQLAARR
jgi:hypothetical protein